MKHKLLLLLASLATSITGVRGEDLFYMYNGQRVPLRANPAKLAVKPATPAPGSGGNAAPSAAAAAVAAQGTAVGVDNWRMVAGGNAPASAGSAASPATTAAGNTAAASAARAKAAESGVAFATPVFDLGGGNEMFPTQNLLVQFKPGVSASAVITSLRTFGVQSGAQMGSSGMFLLNTNLTDGAAVLTLANRLCAHPAVAWAEPETIQFVKPQRVASDPNFGDSWGLRNSGQSGGRSGFDLGAVAAWDVTTGSSSILVVVFDEGIQQNHPDINQIPGRDFTSSPVAGGGTGIHDNHGTAVAFCIAGRMDNGRGSAGIAPGVRVASARIAIGDSQGRWTFSYTWVVNALSWARQIGARVTNHSYGGGSPSSAMDSALLSARNAGIIHFAASANDGRSSIAYPASSPYMIAVGAADRFGNRASFSNYGTGLEFMAPGKDIFTADATGSSGYSFGDYAWVDGTSFASPFAAGVAALILSRNPSWTPSQVLSRMRATCTDMGASGYDTISGHGLLNAARALGASTNPPPPPGDDHGDTLAVATPVAVPSATAGVIGIPSDRDWFRFTLAARSTLTATTDAEIDTFGHLVNASGAVIATDDDGGDGTNFLISRVLDPGTYYIQIHSFAFRTTGRYTLRVAAAPLSPRMTVNGNGQVISDGDSTPSTVDNTNFGLVSSGQSLVKTFTVSNTGNAILALNGAPRVSISGSGAASFSVAVNPVSSISPGFSSSFTIRFHPVASGTQTALISIASNDASTAPYTFTITGATHSTSTDDHGNSRSSATLVSLPSSRGGALQFGGDVDYFRFSLTTTTTVRVFSSSPTNLDLVAYLEDSNGNVIAFSDDGGGNLQFSLTRTLRAGTYFVRVQGFGSGITGSYSFHLARP